MVEIKYFVNMVSGQWIDVFPSDLSSKVSTLAPPSRVCHKFHGSILYIIFYMKTNIYQYQIKKILPTKIKTYTVTSSLNCQLLSTLFCPHLLHPLQICSTHFKFAPPTHFQTSRPMFLHYQ